VAGVDGRWTCTALLAAIATFCACSGGDDSPGDAAPTTTGSTETGTVRVVSQNLLHGIACPAETDGCNLPGRVVLLAQQLDEHGCPELVGLQEANERTVSLLRDVVPTVCDGRYEIVSDDDPGLDREVVLTTLPVLGSQRIRLAGPLRTALWVRVAADVGVVDFVSTHLASGSDDRPCDEATCPPPCSADERVNACQARQLVALTQEVAGDESVVVVGGDLNARADEPAVEALLAAGFSDTHLAAGNSECDSATGDQCTSGRVDDGLTDLTAPASRQTERIDYLFFGGRRACAPVPPTGLFNAAPAAAAAGDVVFPSDHTGVEVTLECETSEAQREEAATATVTTAPATTSTESAVVDPQILAAITDAFRTLFDGQVTDVEAKLAALEDGEILRPYFLASYEAQRAVAPRIRVRIDDVRLVDDDHADVTYTLLLDDAAVLDHLAGSAVQVNGRWLVTRRTYCDVSTQGVAEIPPPCR
jgi:endonuclease/exonuclease/phosphatase family metal-dependent hydrolase